MEIEECLSKMQLVQRSILNLIESHSNEKRKYDDFVKLLNELKIAENINDFKLFLYLLLHIYSFHQYSPSFFDYIKQILLLYKDKIHEYYSNREIFSIFQDNYDVLLYLIESKMLILDEDIANQIISRYIHKYFLPEINPFLLAKKGKAEPIPADFKTKRAQTQSKTPLMQIFIKDSVTEFDVYVKKQKSGFLNKSIDPTEFETNVFLRSKYRVSLIQYAAFYGSVQILQYLLKENVETDHSLWIFAIYSNNQKIIEILEKTEIKMYPENCYLEAIKCYHIDMANYIKNKYLADKSIDISLKCLEFYNFEFIQKDIINASVFHLLCKYDYISFVKALLQDQSIDVNAKDIRNQLFQ